MSHLSSCDQESQSLSFDQKAGAYRLCASRYTPLIVRVNEQLQLYAGNHDHVTFLDCGSGLLQSAPEVSVNKHHISLLPVGIVLLWTAIAQHILSPTHAE